MVSSTKFRYEFCVRSERMKTRSCLSVSIFLSKTTKRILIKFGSGNLPKKLHGEFNFGTV